MGYKCSSSIFYRFTPGEDNGSDDNDDNVSRNRDFEIEKFVTSKGSPRIFGKLPESTAEMDFQNRYYTLPSFIYKSADGSIWFNEQHGNKIAHFDPYTLTLAEYWIPSQNREWGICSNDDDSNSIRTGSGPNDDDVCGIANILQFSIESKGNNDNSNNDEQIWLSEWSENKIGRLNEIEEKDQPFLIDVFKSDEELTVKRGESEKIKFMIEAALESPSSSLDDLRLIVSGTFTSSGYLGNSTGYFDEQPPRISMEKGEGKEVSFEFIPSADLKPGDHILMIGAENDSISYLKAVKIKVI